MNFGSMKCKMKKNYKKKAVKKLTAFKCGRGDSNSHTLRHQILSLACLPIPPRPQVFVESGCKYTLKSLLTNFIFLFFPFPFIPLLL